MRDGRLVTVQNVSQTSIKELVNAIVGRPLSAVFIRAPKPSSEPISIFALSNSVTLNRLHFRLWRVSLSA